MIHLTTEETMLLLAPILDKASIGFTNDALEAAAAMVDATYGRYDIARDIRRLKIPETQK